MRRTTKGFSLIELLIVVAIILIIAAIAIPNFLRARMSANESSAVHSLRTVGTSMVIYSTNYPSLGYAPTLPSLGPSAGQPCVAAPANACLIDSTLAGGYKQGFDFVATGGNIVSGVAYDYYSTAIPHTLHRDAEHSFCAFDDSVVRINAAGTAIASRLACSALPAVR
jgi:prepilin-type N-terminal cleavage/methylation domain-containing protein